MPLTDSHWKLIMTRAIPLMQRDCVHRLAATATDAEQAMKDAQAAMMAARTAHAAAPSDTTKAIAFESSVAVVKTKAIELQQAQETLRMRSTPEGALECFKENWEALSDETVLLATIEAGELANMRSDVEGAKAAVVKMEAELAELESR